MAKTWMGIPPSKCDICGSAITDTFIDGKTIHGPWGNMCPECHKRFGCGLGTGRGQKYEKQGDYWVKVAG